VSLAAAVLAPSFGCDTVDIINRAGLAPLSEWRKRFRFVARYLANLTRGELADITAQDLAVLPVTFADHFSGPETVQQAKALGVPAGVVLWLDVEGLSATMAIADLIAKLNAWADAVLAAGWVPGLYVADRCLLTSAELYALRVVRYWKGAARIVDRFGMLAEPACGWCLWQFVPANDAFGGTRVDYDASAQDYKGRAPVAIVAAAA
jgi:hypothetical protein